MLHLICAPRFSGKPWDGEVSRERQSIPAPSPSCAPPTTASGRRRRRRRGFPVPVPPPRRVPAAGVPAAGVPAAGAAAAAPPGVAAACRSFQVCAAETDTVSSNARLTWSRGLDGIACVGCQQTVMFPVHEGDSLPQEVIRAAIHGTGTAMPGFRGLSFTSRESHSKNTWAASSPRHARKHPLCVSSAAAAVAAAAAVPLRRAAVPRGRPLRERGYSVEGPRSTLRISESARAKTRGTKRTNAIRCSRLEERAMWQKTVSQTMPTYHKPRYRVISPTTR